MNHTKVVELSRHDCGIGAIAGVSPPNQPFTTPQIGSPITAVADNLDVSVQLDKDETTAGSHIEPEFGIRISNAFTRLLSLKSPCLLRAVALDRSP